ncbi:reverse transcriptase domain-containing protein [Algoriphagus sp.]|uniref:reverse transcriptase domain-containing protein n=1 Tax=Algoriphagus sp. TaxID=1872435 RepID=UPI003F7082C8
MVNKNLRDDIREAFKKLSSNIYFDKTNLGLRHMLASFLNLSEEDRGKLFKKLENDIFINKFVVKGKIGVTIMPKKVDQVKIPCMDANFFTNKTQLSPSEVNRLSIFIDTPIEIHLIAVMWTMRYGHILDKNLHKNCFGNRLELDRNEKVPTGRRLFKQYTPQFQKWWSSALKSTQDLLNDGKDATIVNLDFKDYYHRVEFDFSEVEDFIIKISGKNEILGDPLHDTFKKIHKTYKTALKKLGHDGLRDNQNTVPLPIGLISSPVLANFYLRDFDNNLNEKLNPVFYGRYVDDILIVLQNTVIDFEKDFICKNAEGINDKDPQLVQHYFKTHLHSVFEFHEKGSSEEYHVIHSQEKYENLLFQKDKLFIYQFDSELSPDLLKKFENEQKNRVSAFQFLSEDDDNLYVDLDEIVFEDNFHRDELSGGRFKNINDNKYELSVYLAKMVRGSVITGKDFRPDQANKVSKYFKGHQLIKNFYFWEKLLQFWFIREDYQKFFDLYLEMEDGINSLMSNELEERELSLIKSSLKFYLESAFLLAYGLYPKLEKGKAKLSDHHNAIVTEYHSRGQFYRKAGLLRKSCIHFPLAQFVKASDEKLASFALYKMPFQNNDRLELDLDRVFPYRIKFYEVALFEHFSKLNGYGNEFFKENKYRTHDFLKTHDILKSSWQNFTTMNQLASVDVEVQKGYFEAIPGQVSSKESNIQDLEIYLRNGGESKSGKCRIGVVNRYVSLKEDEKSLEGNPIINAARLEEFNRIWDDVNRVPNCDLFIMPELALPWYMAHYYATISVYRQTGFITGLEHFKSGDIGFNISFTCLPITVEGDLDAIPIFRLKNHYSHSEEDWIYKKRMVVPRPQPFRYNLLKWRGLYFTEYNCFELANVRHRNLFYGKIDLLFSPIWNKDMHYYNSLVESTSRDMHLPVIMCNTSQYGDSRVTMPFGHIMRDKLRVKGGNVRDYRTGILVADIDVKQLRYFQIHDYSAAKDFNEGHNSDYKPLPPDYPFEEARKRYDLK